MKKDNKQRLFEVMGKLDKTFNLNEDLTRIGGTKDAEYRRSIQLFEQIFKTQGVYYALAFLYDSQYGNDDLKKMMEMITPKSKSNSVVSANKEIDERYGTPDPLGANKAKQISEATTLPLNIDQIVSSYLETALWSTEEQENGLEGKSIADVDKMSVQGAKKDVIDFLRQAETQAPDELQSYDAKALGHNLWLSRNGHGAGFFDENNDKLQDIARNMKGVDMYLGDDGKVYISGSEPQATPEQSVDEKMIGKKPTGKRDDVAYYKGSGAFPKYTHFAVLKRDNKVLTGWDYRGYDSEDLKSDKRHYFFDDIKDMQIDPKLTKVVTTKYLQKLGIDPFNFDNWNKDNTVFTNENVGGISEGNSNGFKRLMIFSLYDTNGSYLGDIGPINEENNYMNTKSEVLTTPEFQKFAQEKNITAEQIGKIMRDYEYVADGVPLEYEYYAPSGSEELYDTKNDVWYNMSGQQLRSPIEYNSDGDSGEGYTPFGDEG